MSDSSIVFDDLYRYKTEKQYFKSVDYLMTIPSWYPSGVHFELLEAVYLPFQLHVSKSWITIEMALKRSLRGVDYLGKEQLDTLSLMASIVFQVLEEGGELRIHEPKILSVSPFKASIESSSIAISKEQEGSPEVIEIYTGPIPPSNESDNLHTVIGQPTPEIDRGVNLNAAKKSLLEAKFPARSRHYKKIKKAWEL